MKIMNDDAYKKIEFFRRIDEDDAIKTIEYFKNNQVEGGYTLSKSSYVLKNKKEKGEIVDSWAIVTIERIYGGV